MTEYIVYTSSAGHTRRYAEMLSEKLGLPMLDLAYAMKRLDKNTEIIYMGWLFATEVKGYAKAKKRFRINTVIATGLCPTGELICETRKRNSIPDEIPLFTVQGGMDRSGLRGINKFMIEMLIKMLKKNKTPSESDKAMLELIENGGDFVSEENLSSVIGHLK